MSQSKGQIKIETQTNVLYSNGHEDCTHHEPRGAHTGTCDWVTVSSIAAAARHHACFSIVSRWAGLVTEEPRPTPSAAALTRKWVATTAR